ncbi:hypothetical protein R6Q59_022127 [Mikania micrantha]
MSFMKDFDHLKIQMKDILSATNNFDRAKVIGRGGFGRVYKGELSLPKGQITVAFKQLDRKLGQGNIEFWKEIMMLSKYKHENLISLMHFCIEGDEMILVYEYASRGSLDRYLSNASTLPWIQRLRICVGASRGLQFLHDPMETQQRVLHRDIKSANILLDEKWTAKVSDFGLSKIGPANQPQTYLVSNVVGTPGYCDPLYWELGFLTKESDVYSFGVVLFEILCGRLCFEYKNGKLANILVPQWRRCYDQKRLDEIILLGLKEQMDPGSLNTFSSIAYRCVKRAREDRPTMGEVVKELEFSLEQQDILEKLGEKVDFVELTRIADLAVPPLSYGPRSQLLMFLLKGFFVDDGETWISMNMNGKVTKVVSATKCFLGDKLQTKNADSEPLLGTEKVRSCKFPHYLWNVYSSRFKVEVNTQFLSPNIAYNIYIVFQHCGQFNCPCYVPFEYKCDKETHYSTSCIAYINDDTWVMSKLYEFISHRKQQNISIEFKPRDQIPFNDMLAFQGIEIRPMENDSYKKQKGITSMDPDLEINMASDFRKFIKLSKDVIQWETNKELYFILRKGFLIDGEKWFSISKNMKKRIMIPASTFLGQEEWTYNSIPESESRFKVVTNSIIRYQFTIYLNITEITQLFLPQVTYSCHLIYKLSDDYSSIEGPMVIGIVDCFKSYVVPLSICLNPRCRTPIIGAKKHDDDQHIQTPCKMEGHAKQRKDGWMEVQFAVVSMKEEKFILSVEEEKYRSINFFGIVIQGIEFRPV